MLHLAILVEIAYELRIFYLWIEAQYFFSYRKSNALGHLQIF